MTGILLPDYRGESVEQYQGGIYAGEVADIITEFTCAEYIKKSALYRSELPLSPLQYFVYISIHEQKDYHHR